MNNNLFRNKIGGIIVKKNFFSLKKIFISFFIFNIFFILKKLLNSYKVKKEFSVFKNNYNNFITVESLKSDECYNFIKVYDNPSLIVLSLDEILSELQEISTEIVFQDWFDSDFAEKIIDFLGEIAKADGVVLDSEKFTLVDLANLWKVKAHL